MSMLTVAELVEDTSLRLVLVAGGAAADREIEAAAVSELSHPGPWLQGGELLLTIGLLLPDNVDGCRSYLRELDDAGVRAVGLGLGAELPYQRAPDRLVTAADELRMPLLTVPDGVPFIAVTKAVFAYRARAEREALERTLRTQRALTAAAVNPGRAAGHPARTPRRDRPLRRRRRPARPGAGANGSRWRPPRRTDVRTARLRA
jgi:PucR family transcriptional regulator, purine catabolism regulatory protein